VIEVPTTRGGWRVVEVSMAQRMARWLLRVWRKHAAYNEPEARIVKYTPEVEDE